MFKQADNVSGTHYQGVVMVKYKRLVEVFGEPHILGGDKTTVEWNLEFDDGTVATIYDWKENSTPKYEYPWHIGGFHGSAVARVHEALRN